jgi:hypothetical protein
LAGYNQEYYGYNTTQAQKTGIISSTLPYLSITSGGAKAFGGDSSYATRSYFGRINYAFKDRYII